MRGADVMAQSTGQGTCPMQSPGMGPASSLQGLNVVSKASQHSIPTGGACRVEFAYAAGEARGAHM